MRFWAFAICLLINAPAHSSIVRVEMEGSLYQVSSSVSQRFSIGDNVAAWFEYDSSSEGRAWYPGGVLDPNVFYYADAPIAGGFSVAGYSVVFKDSARIFVTDNESSNQGPIDRFIFEDVDPIGDAIAGMPLNNLFFNWQDSTATALRSLALPDGAEIFARLGQPRAAVDWGTLPNGDNRVTALFTNVSVFVSAVPETSTWCLLIFGFGMTGTTYRTRRYRSAISRS